MGAGSFEPYSVDTRTLRNYGLHIPAALGRQLLIGSVRWIGNASQDNELRSCHRYTGRNNACGSDGIGERYAFVT